MGTTRDANGKGFRGPEPGGSGDRSSSRTRGEKAKVERIGRTMWDPLPASNFKEPDDHLKRRSHPSWLPYPGLVLSRLALLRQTRVGSEFGSGAVALGPRPQACDSLLAFDN